MNPAIAMERTSSKLEYWLLKQASISSVLESAMRSYANSEQEGARSRPGRERLEGIEEQEQPRKVKGRNVRRARDSMAVYASSAQLGTPSHGRKKYATQKEQNILKLSDSMKVGKRAFSKLMLTLRNVKVAGMLDQPCQSYLSHGSNGHAGWLTLGPSHRMILVICRENRTTTTLQF